ncbi:uncharacterized protein LOC111110994 [Crassostrea virginica]
MPVKETHFIEFGFHIAENLAYKKRTWQFSTRSHYSSDKAVDGKMTIRMGSGSQCAISGGNVSEAMWMVDLGDVYAIRAIFIYFRIEESKIDSMPSQTIVHCIVQARFIIYYNSRLSTPLRSPDYSKFAYIDLCEVEVYGCKRFGFYGEFCEKPCPRNCKHCHPSTGECLGGCSTGYYGHHCLLYNRENFALLRLTDSKYAFNGYTGSEKAVDGKRKSLSYSGGECFISANSRTFASWNVDLSYPRGIERIVIYYRTDNFMRDKNNQYPSRFPGFSIVVSNTTNPRDGVVCFRDTTLNRSTIPAVFDIDRHVTGRYVIYYNERNPELGYPKDYSHFVYAELCEVEVYGIYCFFFDENKQKQRNNLPISCSTIL